VVNEDFGLDVFRHEAAARLPGYARPLFLRIVTALELTGTFKQRKQELVEQGFDPGRTADPLYFDNTARGRYERLDALLHQRIIEGMERL